MLAADGAERDASVSSRRHEGFLSMDPFLGDASVTKRQPERIVLGSLRVRA